MSDEAEHDIYTKALRDAEAARALNAARCEYVTLFLPHIASQLTYVPLEDDSPARIVVVDAHGKPRMGAKGLMTADELVAQTRSVRGWDRYFRT